MTIETMLEFKLLLANFTLIWRFGRMHPTNVTAEILEFGKIFIAVVADELLREIEKVSFFMRPHLKLVEKCSVAFAALVRLIVPMPQKMCNDIFTDCIELITN